MNQALFTMRRYGYMATLAFTGLIGMGLKWGTQFNETMLSARLQLEKMLPGTRAVNNELQDLFNMAKINPFTFADMTTAFRKMYIGLQPLGVSTAEVNRLLKNMVDALSAAGATNPGNLNRLAVAIQHLAYSGRLTGFAVNQLMKDGIPMAAILNKEFGITGEQLRNVAKYGIPASAAIAAINRYIEQTPSLAGAAARQAKTLGGELATLHDNIAQTVGALTKGLFTKTTGTGGILQNINNMFNGLQATMRKQGQRLTLNDVFGAMQKSWPRMKPFIVDIQELVKVLGIFWNILKNGVIPALVLTATILYYLSPLLDVIFWALKLLTKQMWLVVPVLGILTAMWIVDRLAMMKASLTTKALKGDIWLLNVILGKTTASQKLYAFWTMVSAKASRIWGIFMGRIWLQLSGPGFKALKGYEALVRKLGLVIRTQLIPAIAAWITEQWVLLTTTPVGWILLVIGAIILLTAGIVILYYKWKWFHDLVNTTFTWIWQHWKLMAVILWVLMPPLAILLILTRLIYDHWKQISHLFNWFWTTVLKPIYRWLDSIWTTLVHSLAWGWGQILDMVKAITGWFHAMIGWIDKVIRKIKEMLGWWKKIPGATWIVGAIKTVAGAVGNVASAAWNSPYNRGFFTADTGNQGGSIPVASSIPIAATPIGSPKLNATIHTHVHIDGKQVATSVARTNQKAKARK
jgi:tape measure domain-containing protein